MKDVLITIGLVGMFITVLVFGITIGTLLSAWLFIG